MKRKILWGAMASFISFMIIAIALMTAMFIRMVQMTVPESSSVSPSGPYYDGLYIDLVQEADYQNYLDNGCLLYTSPSPRDVEESRMPSSA